MGMGITRAAANGASLFLRTKYGGQQLKGAFGSQHSLANSDTDGPQFMMA